MIGIERLATDPNNIMILIRYAPVFFFFLFSLIVAMSNYAISDYVRVSSIEDTLT